MNAFIKDIAYYLPKQVLTNEQIAVEFPEWSAEKVAGKVGITERHISAPDETATDMASSHKEMNEAQLILCYYALRAAIIFCHLLPACCKIV